MAPLAQAGGNLLTVLGAVALVGGLLGVVLVNPAVRASIGEAWRRARSSSFAEYFYGPGPLSPAEPSSADVETPAAAVDDFDYSIFQVETTDDSTTLD